MRTVGSRRDPNLSLQELIYSFIKGSLQSTKLGLLCQTFFQRVLQLSNCIINKKASQFNLLGKTSIEAGLACLVLQVHCGNVAILDSVVLLHLRNTCNGARNGIAIGLAKCQVCNLVGEHGLDTGASRESLILIKIALIW